MLSIEIEIEKKDLFNQTISEYSIKIHIKSSHSSFKSHFF